MLSQSILGKVPRAFQDTAGTETQVASTLTIHVLTPVHSTHMCRTLPKSHSQQKN
jgi:hypothetical protein